MAGGTTTLTDCTVSGNSASSHGGGLYTNGGATTLTNCTVSGNTAGNNGGGLANYGSVTLGNTIVAGNTASTSGPDAYGTFTSQGNNLIGETDGSSGWVSSDLTGTIAAPLDPMLGPLANNGGPTQTMALLPDSPAIGAGNVALIPSGVTTDQRGTGYSRTVNGTVDIGAFEFGGSTVESQTISFGPLANQTYGATPVNLTATASSNLPVSFAIISGPATISGSVLTITGAGTVEVEALQGGNSLYAQATPVDETFTVSTATLTITPDAGQSRAYGAAVPVLAETATGFVNGDSASLLKGTLATTATASSGVGTYAFTLGSLSAGPNYTLVMANSSPAFSVTPATLTIQPNAGQSKVYGAAVPGLTEATPTGFVNGDSASILSGSLGTTATASSPVGNYSITLGSLSAGANYTLVLAASPTFGVTPASLVITANSASIRSGQALPVFTAGYSGFVNGDTSASLATPPTLSTTASAGSPAGTYPITVSGASSPNYTITDVPGTLTVTPGPAQTGTSGSGTPPATLPLATVESVSIQKSS